MGRHGTVIETPVFASLVDGRNGRADLTAKPHTDFAPLQSCEWNCEGLFCSRKKDQEHIRAV
jgi:hypothetical protein